MYFDTQRYINVIIIKRLISALFCHFGRYEITLADWLALNNNVSKISKLTNARLVAANIYYRSFNKLIKSLLYLEDFKVPVVKVSSFVKDVKMSASSSPINGSSGHFFGFVKCSFCFKTTQALPSSLVYYVFYSDCLSSVKEMRLLIEIKDPSQPLVDGIIYPLLSVVSSANNSNSE